MSPAFSGFILCFRLFGELYRGCMFDVQDLHAISYSDQNFNLFKLYFPNVFLGVRLNCGEENSIHILSANCAQNFLREYLQWEFYKFAPLCLISIRCEDSQVNCFLEIVEFRIISGNFHILLDQVGVTF